jgi:glucosamine--fructose-6-phosphate aminotransferase (isomerizing)
MCGIIGYVGMNRAAPILIRGLRSLEYRGYDSAGVATLDNLGKSLHVSKTLGPVEKLESSPAINLPGMVGIAHTRWATHGQVNLKNAHPHLDCSHQTAVVHNGIIENADDLRSDLESRGHCFVSDTDTEVIPHLVGGGIQRGQSVLRAVMEATRRLEGSYAFLVLSSNDDGCIYASKRNLPLLVGLGQDFCVATSDSSALPRGVDRAVLLEDEDMVIIDNSNIEILDSTSEKIPISPLNRPIVNLGSKIEQPGLSGYKHYMEKEIHEQPSLLHRISSKGLSNLDLLTQKLVEGNRIFLIGSGTSYHACLTGSYFLGDIAGIPAQPILSSSFARFSHLLGRDDVVLAVTQSGETADVLDAMQSAQATGATVLGLVNNPHSAVARMAEVFVPLEAGVEKGVAATKTYTAQLAALYLAAHRVGGQKEGKRNLARLSKILEKSMEDLRENVQILAKGLHSSPLMILIGRDDTHPTALEAALKIREISYIPSFGMEGGELKHGSLALIEEGTPCLSFVSSRDRGILANLEEAASRGARIVGFCEGDYRMGEATGGKMGARRVPENGELDVFDEKILLPYSGNLFPISAVIPAQMISYEMALLRGNNPDRPRNLAKCVTVR